MFLARRTTTFFVPICIPLSLCRATVAPELYIQNRMLINYSFWRRNSNALNGIKIFFSPQDMLRMHILLPAQLVGQTCEISYRTFRFGRIFAGFSVVDTNLPKQRQREIN